MTMLYNYIHDILVVWPWCHKASPTYIVVKHILSVVLLFISYESHACGTSALGLFLSTDKTVTIICVGPEKENTTP